MVSVKEIPRLNTTLTVKSITKFTLTINKTSTYIYYIHIFTIVLCISISLSRISVGCKAFERYDESRNPVKQNKHFCS